MNALDLELPPGCVIRRSVPVERYLEERKNLNPKLNSKIQVLRDLGSMEGDSVMKPGTYVDLLGTSGLVMRDVLLSGIHILECSSSELSTILYELLVKPEEAKLFNELENHKKPEFRLLYSRREHGPEYKDSDN